MAELEKSLTASGFDVTRSLVLTDVPDLTSAADAAKPASPQQRQDEEKKEGGKKSKKKKNNDNNIDQSKTKIIEKKDLVKALLDKLTRGWVSLYLFLSSFPF